MKRIEPNIVEVLSTLDIQGNHVKINAQLDRKTYVKMNEVLESFGGEWNKKLKVHVFPESPADFIGDCIATGQYLDPKSGLNYFPTPQAVVEIMLNKVAHLRSVPYIMEPSAGTGAIADLFQFKSHNPIEVCEINEKFHPTLKEKGFKVVGTDFIDFVKRHDEVIRYNLIAANPPFSKGREIEHVSGMLDMADTVVTVMSPAIIFRDTSAVRRLKDKLTPFFNWEIEELPEGSFKESGTNVNSIILFAERK